METPPPHPPPSTTSPPQQPPLLVVSVTTQPDEPHIITYYLHPVTLCFIIIILLLGHQKISKAITHHESLFLSIFISIFIVHFVVQFHILKSLSVSKISKTLIKEVWFDLYLMLQFTCQVFWSFYPLETSLIPLSITCLLLMLWVVMFLFLIGDLKECWKQMPPEENIVQAYSDGAGNVVGISVKL